jgi:hypothetical protein
MCACVYVGVCVGVCLSVCVSMCMRMCVCMNKSLRKSRKKRAEAADIDMTVGEPVGLDVGGSDEQICMSRLLSAPCLSYTCTSSPQKSVCTSACTSSP